MISDKIIPPQIDHTIIQILQIIIYIYRSDAAPPEIKNAVARKLLRVQYLQATDLPG